MKKIFSIIPLLLLAALSLPRTVQAVGWPANYQGVMLQAFYWDSYTDTKWPNLESQADELSQYFRLLWVPNSAKAEGSPTMGYHPIYWFTNHNSSFGTEAQLRSMISTYKAKGVGVIGDFVVNHRSGVSSWTNFPTETWNGQTWHIGLDGICCNDEVNNPGNPGGATGNYDTGDNWDGARDLDHTNANVQNNVKNYAKCLLTDFGYSGLRYDMVKGYRGEYVKMYNQYANVTYSVGEYWDNYDAIAAWIEATGKTSAAFDFPCKYAINEAFHSGDMSKLVWKANGVTDQPAGLIHFGYPQYAVTFIDNHDTYGNESKFNGNVVAANAFILFSPGTPCVFLPHYKAYKAPIQKLINLRNACGITNTSSVTVLRSSYDCYMAEITGTKYKAVVKIGSAQVSPDGYTNDDIKASGTDYCVWTKANATGGGGDYYPENLYLMGSLEQGSWKPNVGVKMTKSGSKYTASNVKLVADPNETNAFFSFVTSLGSTGDVTEWDEVVNASDRYGATSKDELLTGSAAIRLFSAGVDASGAYSWAVAPGTHTVTADLNTMVVTIDGSDPTPDPDPDPDPDPSLPAHFYILGEVNGNSWDPAAVVEMDVENGKFVKEIELTPAVGGTDGYFSFCLNPGTAGDWDTFNATGQRYAPLADTQLVLNGSAASFEECIDGNSAKAFYAAAGKYRLVVDWANKTAALTEPGSGVETILDENVPARWFNLQGVEISEPLTTGIYIRVQGRKIQKILLTK